MIDRAEILRIWRGARNDAVIMVVTFLGTLFLHIEFAVLAGILLSFAVYIMRTSVPQVYPVLPDDDFRHFTFQPQKPHCPQLAIIDILGDLYFGAVNHIEEAILRHLNQHPEQRFLLLRMHSVQHCDFSGIHMLENLVRIFRERGGDVYFVRVRRPVLDVMRSCGFYHHLGADHVLPADGAVSYLFHRILDPAVCIYECNVRAFLECQNLPKRVDIPDVPPHIDIRAAKVDEISARTLWQQLHNRDTRPLIIDVREPREFHQGHIAEAELLPLPEFVAGQMELPRDRPVVLVCRSGRRSQRAAYLLKERGYSNVATLQGGMLAWEVAGLLEAVD